MRKIYVDITVSLIIRADEGVDIDDVLDDMDYNFKSNNDGADIEDTKILDYKLIDST